MKTLHEKGIDLARSYGLKVQNDRIVSPGKFENQPVYVLSFYEDYMNGDSGVILDDESCAYNLSPLEKRELNGTQSVSLYFDSCGFIAIFEHPCTAEELFREYYQE